VADKLEITRQGLDDLYNGQRLSICEIAERLGVSQSTVRHRMIMFDLPRRTDRLPLDENEIERLYLDEQLSMREIGQKMGVSYETIRSRLNERGVAIRDNNEAIRRYPRHDFAGSLMEKAYLIGFRLGDLTVRMRNQGTDAAAIQVECTATHVEQINLALELFSPYGHVHVSSLRKSGVRDVSCHLNLSFDFLLPKQDAIPEWILGCAQQGDMELFLAFLAGYTDARGRFSTPPLRYNARFTLSSCDENILKQIRALLNDRLDVKCLPACLQFPKGYRNERGGKLGKDPWRLSVYRKSSLNRLCELLDPYLKHAERRADMHAVWANVIARGVEC
jgi:predicted DNA-binding protein YlxM (UPF0122 family)